MNELPAVVQENSSPVRLGSLIARGGEGAIYRLKNKSHLVAKIYHQPPSSQTVQKLRAMIHTSRPEVRQFTAWPTDILYYPHNRQVAGFLMSRVVDCRPIQNLYHPECRLKFFPDAPWSFQIQAARNLAAAFDEIHRAGYLIGDVNEQNILVSPKALIRIIDCDSFQVQIGDQYLLCEVATPDYLPPELYGVNLSSHQRLPNHDYYGLAVLIYKLLFLGRHPYQGVYHGAGELERDDFIRQYRFCQGPAAKLSNVSPPLHTPTFEDIPPDLGTLFRRAFERGGASLGRPKPTEWMTALDRFVTSLQTCDRNPGHTYWKGQKYCTWCRIIENNGPEYYFTPSLNFSHVRVPRAIIRALEVQFDEYQLQLRSLDTIHQFQIKPCQPKALPDELHQLKQNCELKYRLLRNEKALAPDRQAARAKEMRKQLKNFRKQIRTKYAQEQQILKKAFNDACDAYQAWKQQDAQNGQTFLSAILAFLGFTTRAQQQMRYWKNEAEKIEERLQALPALQSREIRAVAAKVEQMLRQEDEIVRQKRLECEQAEAALNAAFCREFEKRQSALQQSEQQVQRLRSAWQTRSESYRNEQNKLREQFAELRQQIESMWRKFEEENRRIAPASSSQKLDEYLKSKGIIDAVILSIGSKRKDVLSANGITTAFDIDQRRLERLPGFGPHLIQQLLSWKQEMIDQFDRQFNPRASLLEQKKLVEQYCRQEKPLLDRLKKLVEEMKAKAENCKNEFDGLKGEIEKALQGECQARADLDLLQQARSYLLVTRADS